MLAVLELYITETPIMYEKLKIDKKKYDLLCLPGKLVNKIGRLIILEWVFNSLQGISTEVYYESKLGVTSLQSRYSNSAVT